MPEAFHARFPVSGDETKLPDAREKKPLVPSVGERRKATTGISLKMFLKRSVDCRIGCFLRSMSWMLGRAGLLVTVGFRSLVSLVAGLFSFKASFRGTCFTLVICSLMKRKSSFIP